MRSGPQLVLFTGGWALGASDPAHACVSYVEALLFLGLHSPSAVFPPWLQRWLAKCDLSSLLLAAPSLESHPRDVAVSGLSHLAHCVRPIPPGPEKVMAS